MEHSSTPAIARRSEDIALDLLKFLAAHTHVGSKSVSSTPGFAAASPGKADDQITQLLELYSRCREAVELPLAPAATTPSAKK